jgi:hypothetical protein
MPRTNGKVGSASRSPQALDPVSPIALRVVPFSLSRLTASARSAATDVHRRGKLLAGLYLFG